ncbi:hypothetical protein COB55_02230 [Candidatus Wolfebacteria bacterium]|nr:MAG: hypothetical protein COB55_02230 [Candidatus Wolfebacteria bacterium]
MTLDTFIQSTLTNITKGVKDANNGTRTGDNKNSFALKNSNWFTDKINGCISFDICVEDSNGEIKLVTSRSKTSESAHRVKFNVAQLNPVS